MAGPPHRFQTRMATAGERPQPVRKIIRVRMPNSRANSSPMARALSAEMPRTSASRSGCFSITSRVLSRNRSTSRRAMAGPMPLMAPEERYFKMALEVVGRVRRMTSALNWWPNRGWTS